jgi:hypothetical protein
MQHTNPPSHTLSQRLNCVWFICKLDSDNFKMSDEELQGEILKFTIQINVYAVNFLE